MNLEHDPTDVPDDVTPLELERAYDADPLPYPGETPDDLADDNVSPFASFAPASPREALSHAHLADVAGTFFGVGMCLQAQRGFWDVAALWPTAALARVHSAPAHTIPPRHFPPRGSVGFAANHVWMNLGAGLVRTTDFHRAGKVDVALLSRMLPWCGDDGHVWGEVLNGVDVWPSRNPKPKPPHSWSPAERADFLKDAIRAALDAGRTHEAVQLREWRRRILERLDK